MNWKFGVPPPNPWKEAVISALCTMHIIKPEHDNDPRGAINDLLIMEAQMNLDPAVSQDAAALIEMGRLEERTRWTQVLTNVLYEQTILIPKNLPDIPPTASI